MAMFLFSNRIFVVLLIEFLLVCENGLLIKGKATDTASGKTLISGPFLSIEPHATTRLIITNAHLPHFLSCVATIDEDYYYYQNETAYYHSWLRNDNTLNSFSNRRTEFFLFRNGTLRLPTNEKASGVYRCKINANLTAVISESITVEYPVLKRTSAATNITGLTELSLTLNCPVLSVPPANITWSRGNVTLKYNFIDSRYLILANGSLVLRKLLAQDEGKYICTAQNLYTTKSHRQIVMSIRVKPRLDKAVVNDAQLIPVLQHTTLYIPSGETLRLACRSLADVASIEWWYQRSPETTLVKLSNHSYEYHMENVSYKEHEGYYICATPFENQRFFVVITVPPIITEPLPSYEGLIAKSMTFRCFISGNPRPVVSWYHNGARFNSSYTSYINGNELHIHSFDPDEDGIYQCFARNIAGEAYSAGEIRFRNKGDEVLRKNPLQHIKCFPHSFNTINLTFETVSSEKLFMVHIVQQNPHVWISNSPMQLRHTNHAIISSHVPLYRPFELITRVLFPTSAIRLPDGPQQQTLRSSLRSPPVTCCSQGMLLHLVHVKNDTLITWSQPDLDIKKYFILQFSTNYTRPHPAQLFANGIRGTMEHVELTPEDVVSKLSNVEALKPAAAREVLKRAESGYSDNEVRNSQPETDEDIFSLVVPANVTGILMQNYTRIKIRVLIITTENEDLAQDFRYVQWKIIQNDTTEQMTTPFRLTTVESRVLVFHFEEGFNEPCVHVCHSQIHFPIISNEDPKCEKRSIVKSQLEIRNLKPTERYHLNFFSCETQMFYGQLDVQTLPDPPGTINNQRVTRQNGLKLRWDPPLQPNGKIHHYNILWTVENVTHEANVLDCTVCSYKFPNITETAKINVTVRVVGETGVGAPVFLDLRGINHKNLEEDEDHSPFNSEIYNGIAIGSLLSTFCIFCFALLIIFQRRRFKSRPQGPTHLTLPSDTNFGNLSNTTVPGDSAGGLSGSTLQQDCHEMQTLIPKSGRHIEFLAERPNEYQTTQLPNGNGKIPRHQEGSDTDPHSTSQQDFDYNLSQIPLCSSTPERKAREPALDAKPFFIPFKHTTPPNTVAAQATTHKQHSSSTHTPGGHSLALTPPSTLPLVATLPSGYGSNSARRSGSLSNSSTTSSSSGSRKQFHTNYPKHAKSNDGICLLAEEESAATVTPTSDTENTGPSLTNGFQTAVADSPTTATNARNKPSPTIVATNSAPTSHNDCSNIANINNNNSKSRSTSKPAQPEKSRSNLLGRRSQTATNTAPAYHSNAPIVPGIGPTIATTTSTNAATQRWPTTRASAEPSATHKFHRRPNVDPNG